MILYFTGTGNTAIVAEKLAAELHDDNLLPLKSEDLLHPETLALHTKGNRVIWAFPVYSWGIPPVMVNFIRKVGLSEEVKSADHYMLVTCGDDIGYCDRQWRKEMYHRGLRPVYAYAVQMPNTYVCMPGFDIDSPQLEKVKLDSMPAAVKRVAESIKMGGPDILIRKSFSWFKTYVIYRWFKKYAMSAKPFHSTSGCVGCGRCAKSCPMKNIDMTDSHPVWSDHCAVCLRCYHICPCHAVEYGKQTAKKGQVRVGIKYLCNHNKC